MTRARRLCAMKGDRHRPSPDCRTGTAALEFVIILPVLLLVSIGAADLSRAMHYENVLSNAAREGAAYGAVHPVNDFIESDWEARIIERAREEAANLPKFDGDLLEITVLQEDGADGSRRVRVRVSYPFELLVRWPGWPRTVSLSKETAMRSYR